MAATKDMYLVDGKWIEVNPTKFTVKHFSKDVTKEVCDTFVVEHDASNLALFGTVEDLPQIFMKLLEEIDNKEAA